MLPFQINDLYQFYYTHPTNGQTQVYPANNSLSFQWKREKGQIFFRKDLTTTLNFVGDDFKELYRLDRSKYRCEKLNFEVHRKCGETYSLYWTGYLALIDGDFDVTKCKVAIKPRIEDKYSCLMKDWKKEKDYIGGVGAPPALNDLRLTEGTVVYTQCEGNFSWNNQVPLPQPEDLTPISSCLNLPETWTMVNNYYVPASDTNPLDDESEYSQTTVWAREEKYSNCIDGTPIAPYGEGWVLVQNNCPTNSLWARKLVNEDFKLKNGRDFREVLKYLVSECNLTVKSDFFNINPDNSHPINSVYDYADFYLKELVIFQKSDIRYPNGKYINNQFLHQVATKALIKLYDLLENLRIAFNVRWDIIDGFFRIEHLTYWQQRNLMLDLTQAALKHRIAGFHKYKYLKEESPVREKFSWMEPSDDDFDSFPIEYDPQCSYDNESENEIEENANIITTNISFIISNPDKIADPGNVLVATRDGAVITDLCYISQSNRVNAPLAFSNLLYNLHRHGRPQYRGKMNKQDEEFITKVRTRSQEGITLQLCCNDLATFDPQDSVKTQLGWGDVESATLTDPQSVLKLNLVHE